MADPTCLSLNTVVPATANVSDQGLGARAGDVEMPWRNLPVRSEQFTDKKKPPPDLIIQIDRIAPWLWFQISKQTGLVISDLTMQLSIL
jgi:hypothetical protein